MSKLVSSDRSSAKIVTIVIVVVVAVAAVGGGIAGQYNAPKPITISGMVADGSYPYGSLVGIPNAIVSCAGYNSTTDQQGRFSLTIPAKESDPILEISAPGFVSYRERPSRMVNGAFHLIPKDLYRGFALISWSAKYNNWHRKWEQQTEFVIVRKDASEDQINALLAILATDEYRKMTGGRFTSTEPPTLAERKPTGSDREGKTVISFSPDVSLGGIAHAEDRNGIIYYGEITWNTNQVLNPAIVWHEMAHTVTAGGHINEWPSVVSEIHPPGKVTETDEKIFNCIYNSPPLRNN